MSTGGGSIWYYGSNLLIERKFVGHDPVWYIGHDSSPAPEATTSQPAHNAQKSIDAGSVALIDAGESADSKH